MQGQVGNKPNENIMALASEKTEDGCDMRKKKSRGCDVRKLSRLRHHSQPDRVQREEKDWKPILQAKIRFSSGECAFARVARALSGSDECQWGHCDQDFPSTRVYPFPNLTSVCRLIYATNKTLLKDLSLLSQPRLHPPLQTNTKFMEVDMTSEAPRPDFTEPTTHYWQNIFYGDDIDNSVVSDLPRKYSWPVVLPDNGVLLLPIRPLNTNPKEAVASLLINQASLNVADTLASFLSHLLHEFLGEVKPDVIIGLPTLGLSVAVNVARGFGLSRTVPLGYSRKFWYDEDLSTELSSITSPLGQKRVYLDPNQLPLIKGKNVVIIDDAVSSGKTLKAIWDLLESEKIGCNIIACGVLMKQGSRWKDLVGERRTQKLIGVFDSPLLQAVEGGWDIRE
ncbi:hypothetical protein G7Y89_g7144 [Cudoniella acicularis]|uniref:Phosphoribosyltransferase domain-containing protein n=1 Tax=Cudoniella acicularis TaxID=354080 RepID=A0A8H4W1T5_9HELO|nr:hypothetical protein G7Y89_g7144 [Cudoniella acicularis]